MDGTDSGGAKIVTVQDINDDDISKGLVDAQSGFVTFEVKFYAILFRAFTNEVLLATVKQVSEVRVAAAMKAGHSCTVGAFHSLASSPPLDLSRSLYPTS